MPTQNHVGVLPGAFDPVTNGHLDLIRRAALQVDELIVGVAHNPNKMSLFSPQERIGMIEESINSSHLYRNVKVMSYEGMTVKWAASHGAQCIFRGIRDQADLHYEMQMANINRSLGKMETLFLLAADDLAMVSSTYIRQIAAFAEGDISQLTKFVPAFVAEKLAQKVQLGELTLK